MQENFSIGDVAKQTGITDKQLRYWEEKGFIKPTRIVTGKHNLRRYSFDQVLFIKEVKRYLDMGYTLPTAVALGKDDIEIGGDENGSEESY